MGMWAYQPWDNDQAADWYGDLMDSTGLRKAWLRGITLPPDEEPELVRAAAALFVMLGRVYVWPIDNFDADLETTIAALSRVAQCDQFKDSPPLLELIAVEISELKSRRKPGALDPDAAAVASSKPWWRLW